MEDQSQRRTVRAFYDNGEVRFTEPVHFEGCWNLEITFVEQIDEEGIPLEANPYRPQVAPLPDRLEELHRKLEDERPPKLPY